MAILGYCCWFVFHHVPVLVFGGATLPEKSALLPQLSSFHYFRYLHLAAKKLHQLRCLADQGLIWAF